MARTNHIGLEVVHAKVEHAKAQPGAQPGAGTAEQSTQRQR